MKQNERGAVWPDAIEGVEDLEECLSRPSPGAIEDAVGESIHPFLEALGPAVQPILERTPPASSPGQMFGFQFDFRHSSPRARANVDEMRPELR